MRDLDYYKLLSHEFRDERSCQAEIINLRAISALPKGNEYFFSDIHGEYESFIHMLRSASGIVGEKIREIFGASISKADKQALTRLIYHPHREMSELRNAGKLDAAWYERNLQYLLAITREVSSKFTRSKVRKKLPDDFGYAIDELLHNDGNVENKRLYYQEIIIAIIESGAADDFVIVLSELIKNLLIDKLHIIGDIFDRGPRADFVMDEIMEFDDVDIQWGNHDVSWMGAAAGNTSCIATVLRIATGYNSFDVLEDGYGINLRPLSMFAAETYKEDDCVCFKPHLLDRNQYDSVEPELAAKMCKAITIIELKLEGQLIKRHPEYEMEGRLLLDKIDYDKGEIKIGGKIYPLKDKNFPTINREDPYKLTEEEEALIETLRISFMHSARLQKHIRYLYAHGSTYKVCNNNLLFHGCIPVDETGEFIKWHTPDGIFKGKRLMDYLEEKIIDAYFLDGQTHPEKKQYAVDLMWYLWAGAKSPLFGKDKMTTFEHLFVEDKDLSVETYNPYYTFNQQPEFCKKIFAEFKMDLSEEALLKPHIINGHVPVKTVKGQKPVKADGRLYVIDGGISKAYHKTTGIAGYTLIFNSHHLALAEHRDYVPGEENIPEIEVTEVMERRVLVKDTDAGAKFRQQIKDLEELKKCYQMGLIRG